MSSCKEFFLDDVMAICAIPITKINTAATGSPALALAPTVVHDFTQYFDSDTITIGHNAPVGSLIPIMRLTGKAKDEESDNTAGRLHTVTVNCQVDDRDLTIWDNLLALERTPSHLLITFRDMTRGFVAATDDTYLCIVDRDGAKTSVQFRIQNLMGIQLVPLIV